MYETVKEYINDNKEQGTVYASPRLRTRACQCICPAPIIASRPATVPGTLQPIMNMDGRKDAKICWSGIAHRA